MKEEFEQQLREIESITDDDEFVWKVSNWVDSVLTSYDDASRRIMSEEGQNLLALAYESFVRRGLDDASTFFTDENIARIRERFGSQ